MLVEKEILYLLVFHLQLLVMVISLISWPKAISCILYSNTISNGPAQPLLKKLITFSFQFMVLCVQEASPSHVASAATLSVAFMEALSAVFQSFGHNYK